MRQIESIFTDAGLLHDRFFGEVFTLPYSFDAIKIQPNELATYHSLNVAFDKLYTNFLALYGVTKLGSNVVPYGGSMIAGISGHTLCWVDSATNQSTLSTFSSIGLGYIDSATNVVAEYNATLGCNILILNSLSSVSILSASETTSSISVLLSTAYADTNTQLPFTHITSSAITDTAVYLTDSYYNNIYQYNIASRLLDRTTSNTLIPVNIVGGTGSYQEPSKFNNITAMCILSGEIYISDADNYTVKVYDLSLNFRRLQNLYSVLIGNRIMFLASDEASSKIIAVTETQQVIILNTTLEVVKTADFSRFVGSNETVQSVYTLKSYRNFFYITTNTTTYKFYVSKPGNLIGRFSLYRFGIDNATTYRGGATCKSSSGLFDTLYILGVLNGVTRLIQATDTPNYAYVLKLSDFEVYEQADIEISPEEYIQPFVINKAIAKLVLNHIRLKDQIIGRFFGSHDSKNNLVLGGYLYFLLADLDLTAYDITPDHFIGLNEALTNTAVNRGLQLIYNLQVAMLEKSDTPIFETVTYANAAVNILD